MLALPQWQNRGRNTADIVGIRALANFPNNFTLLLASDFRDFSYYGEAAHENETR